MGYGGESWNKKLARSWVLSNALNVRQLFEPKDRVCMVLAGPDAADVRCLRFLGATPKNIIAVDSDAQCIDAVRRVEPEATVFHGDLLSAAREYRGSVDLLVADMCAQLNESSVEYFARVAAIAGHAETTLISAFSYGREIGHRNLAVRDTKTEGFAIVRENAGVGYARMYRDLDAKAARLTLFLRHMDQAFAKRECVYVPVPRVYGPTSIFYGAQKPSGAVTPMVYFIGGLMRTPPSPTRAQATRAHAFALNAQAAYGRVPGVVGDPELFADDHVLLPDALVDEGTIATVNGGQRRVREEVVAMQGFESAADVADEYNLSVGQVAAWWAVNTRQKQA